LILCFRRRGPGLIFLSLSSGPRFIFIYLASAQGRKQKRFDRSCHCGMIPYNLKKGIIMDYLALKIPADIKQKITSHTVVDQPEPEEGGGYPFQGDNGAYELCGCDMIQIVPAAYTDVKRGHHLEGDLYCDEEALLKAAPVHNWRASQMRYWHMLPRKTELDPNWRDYCHIAGDACFVVPATDDNLKMMESILDS
jgi:hypothetical protein